MRGVVAAREHNVMLPAEAKNGGYETFLYAVQSLVSFPALTQIMVRKCRIRDVPILFHVTLRLLQYSLSGWNEAIVIGSLYQSRYAKPQNCSIYNPPSQ